MKKTVSKIGGISFVFILVLTLFFVSGISKTEYFVGDVLYYGVDRGEDVIIKIRSPSFEYEEIVIGGEFSYVFEESGEHSFLIKFSDGTQKLEFDVAERDVIYDSLLNLTGDSEDLGELEETYETRIVVGEDVRRMESVDVSDMQNVKLKIHNSAKDIVVRNEEGVVFDYEFRNDMVSGIFGALSGESERSLVIKNAVGQLTVEYSTPGPTKEEEEISDVEKEVIVYSEDGLHYENVLANTTVEELVTIENAHLIKVFWKEENRYLDFEALDLDDDTLIDTVVWVVPHLSTQTFRVILISDALHLDENREFVSDIYENVSKRDGIWQFIPGGHFVRVTFEKALKALNDITLYAKSTGNKSVRVEIYEKDSDEVLAVIDNISDDDKYQVFLSELEGFQDTFDLRIVDDLWIDLIIDPSDFTSCVGHICTEIFNSTGSTTWQAPSGVTSVNVTAVGGGGGGSMDDGGNGGSGGGGGGLGWRSDISVVPGNTYDVVVGVGEEPSVGVNDGEGVNVMVGVMDGNPVGVLVGVETQSLFVKYKDQVSGPTLQ